MLHWKDKSEEAKGSQPQDDKGTQACIAEGTCLEFLFLSGNIFFGELFGEILFLCPVVTWILTYNIFLSYFLSFTYQCFP